ncbi:lightoid-like [Planoprotostelium fungivorum]|uniref:Ras-related protein Rab n=1 Tax=Planoprotostelium fungivorum TaxID=1890364 RepID=A0A2P6N026_9EUKA|nr:lightoid-like [Planoprotostelium fungivorum]
MADDGEREEHVYKILVVGEQGCGKTSFIHQYVNHTFSKTYRATIGVDFALKSLNWDSKTNIRLQLWDIAGQERFGHMTRVYYKEAVGAMVVFDITKEKTLQAVPKWKNDIDDNLDNIPVVLLANKCDLAEQPLDKAYMEQFCKENGFIGWFETSAKDNINVDESGHYLVEHILNRDPEANKSAVAGKAENTVPLNIPQQQEAQKTDKNCAC